MLTLEQTSRNYLSDLMVCSILAFLFAGCTALQIEESKEGKIVLSVSGSSFSGMKSEIYSRLSLWSSALEGIDTNNFHLSIYSGTGGKVYEGKYGARPEEIVVLPGAYDIKLSSSKFHKPAFDSPQYGDEQTVIVDENATVAVTLNCRMTNSAMRLTFSETFREMFPGEGITIVEENGELFYPYDQESYAYLNCGTAELHYRCASTDTLLFSRRMEPAQMLTLNLSYSKERRSASMKVDFDTTRKWISEDYDTSLRIPTGALTIPQAKEMIGEKNIMVFGYILGGDATISTIRVGAPFTSRTNIVIAPTMLERNRNNMFVVELPSGDIREELNLVVHPEHLGKAIVVTGNIAESYYGYPGIKSTKAYSIL